MARTGHTDRSWIVTIAVVACAIVLAACETAPSKEAVGTVGGAALGGLVGSAFGSGSGRTAAIIGGALVGGAVGNVIGRRMDEQDRMRMNQALNANAPGQSSTWKNETTGHTYTVTPERTFVQQDGRQCRTFVQEAIIDGQPQKIEGTACRRADGTSWENVS